VNGKGLSYDGPPSPLHQVLPQHSSRNPFRRAAPPIWPNIIDMTFLPIFSGTQHAATPCGYDKRQLAVSL
jgi:hypothetical protein